MAEPIDEDPRACPAPPETQNERARNGDRSKCASVLLVDDEFEFRNAIGEALHEAGAGARGGYRNPRHSHSFNIGRLM